MIFSKKKKLYVNESHIDTFIDKYWLDNCPDTLSISENNNQTQKLLHLILMSEFDDEKSSFENEEKSEDHKYTEIKKVSKL